MQKINDKKTDGFNRPFSVTEKLGSIQKIRLCRTSAKGEPAKSRWVPHLDASNFP